MEKRNVFQRGVFYSQCNASEQSVLKNVKIKYSDKMSLIDLEIVFSIYKNT